MLAEFWGDNLPMYGTRNWQFVDSVKPLPGDHVIHKTTYSGFHGTDLESVLQSLGVDTIVIVGVLTNCCCETTAREAFVRGFLSFSPPSPSHCSWRRYRVVFVADATATSNMTLQLLSLVTLAFGFAYIVTSEKLIQELST
eukprot:TRINITY_DN5010_c2_g1_i1.p1 TRINITY_DN5010_c2_g1~~TRINITY_DN5010_c2_g1_i1.p1  ORF type:complete len:141 (-),score=16.02 TRINITY_DN5010_c2_g1_i1:24-446(-)